MIKNYRPVRILLAISVAGSTIDALALKYPHSEVSMVRSKGAKTNTLSRKYPAGKVIDAPTSEEREIFDSLSNSIVIDIPQHKDGYDDPRSGLARSRKGSANGRQKFLLAEASRPVPKPTRLKKTSNETSLKKGGDKINE